LLLFLEYNSPPSSTQHQRRLKGHLSHGYQTNTKKISAVSKYYETFPYRLNEETGVIDYGKRKDTM